MQQFKLTTYSYDANALVDTGRTNSYICKNFVNQQNINYKSIKFATNVADLSLKTKICGMLLFKFEFLFILIWKKMSALKMLNILLF